MTSEATTSRGSRPWEALYGYMPHSLIPRHATALELFDRALERPNGKPLVWYFDTPVAAATIDADATALAVALRDHGVSPGDRVLFQLQNMPQFLVVLIATWRLGAIAVPVNAMYRERELAILLADSRPAAVVVLDELWEQMQRAVTAVSLLGPIFATSAHDYLEQTPPSCLGSRFTELSREAVDLASTIRDKGGQLLPAVPLERHDVAVLIYTSGTTGPPKAAMIQHKNLVFSSTVFADWMRLGPDDVVMGLAPPFHVSGLVANIGVGLVSGAPVVLAHRFDAGESLRLIEARGATFTTAAITAFTALMNHPSFEHADLSSLKTPCTGGAPVAAAILERWRRATGHYIRNTYGMTETTAPTHLTPLDLEAPVDPESGAVSVGIPVCDTFVEVVDDEGRRVPTGELGEFVSAGPQVVPGYWQQPQETAHAFIDGRLHTGDIGFMNEQGWFFLQDRSKDVIIASGYKVWPREVEDILCEHPDVREAAVVGVADDYRGETVKAFVSLRAGAQATDLDLVGFCRARMAAYKYPRSVEILEELPKNASGKILRRELRHV